MDDIVTEAHRIKPAEHETTEPEPASTTYDAGYESDISKLSTRSTTPSPPKPKDSPINISDRDSESELSSLGDTPPPPTPPQQASEPERVVHLECTHTGWCDCPMHGGHATGARIPHLSEWALSQLTFPESNVRAEPRPEPLRDWVQKWTDWVLKALLVMGLDEQDQLRRRAQGLVWKINIDYPPGPPFELPPPVIVRIGQAISTWRQDLDYDRLNQTVSELLDLSKDLLFLFETFLPPRLRTVTREQALGVVQREASKGMEQSPLLSGASDC